MLKAPVHIYRLLKAARVLARHGGLATPQQLAQMPLPARLGIRLLALGPRPRYGGNGGNGGDGELSAASAAIARLGPSWVKLGQFLATRPDVVGFERARQLAELQDRLPPFPQQQAERIVEQSLGRPLHEVFSDFGPPIAAASIAQVHRARTSDGRDVAVKVLRPGIEQRFADDLESFYFAARWLERLDPASRRLKPVEVVDTLKRSMDVEMDLRMEAAAMSEIAENLADEPRIHIPQVDWQRTSKRVLTTEWVEGIPIADREALQAAGHDLPALADTVIHGFLEQLLRDGFFHADMHPGNLFVDAQGRLVLVDFGITGHLSEYERRVWAEIIYCFIIRDYHRNAQVHFEAGYVPPHHSAQEFAQALRAIGEPVFGRPAAEVSMGELLEQLFRNTGHFDMATQPQLLMMQKTMVVVEGVARALNPHVDVWKSSEPVVKEWIERHLGAAGRLQAATRQTGQALARLPETLNNLADAARALAREQRDQQVAQPAPARWPQAPLWLVAAALAAIAAALWR